MFGFCRPENFLFKRYVFGFVEANVVFPRNAPTKSEAPTPPAQLFGVLFYIYFYTFYIHILYTYSIYIFYLHIHTYSKYIFFIHIHTYSKYIFLHILYAYSVYILTYSIHIYI